MNFKALIVAQVISVILTSQGVLAQTSANSQKSSPLSLKDWVEIVVSIAGAGLGIYTIWRGVEQYKKDQKWRRAEFVAQQIKDFESDSEVKKVLLILDWKDREFEIDGKKVLVTDELFIKSIEEDQESHIEKSSDNQRNNELWVRYNFIHFLDALDNFGYFLEANLVTKEELEPHLKYWLRLIYGKNNRLDRSEIFYQNINKFIEVNEYKGVQKLHEELNY